MCETPSPGSPSENVLKDKIHTEYHLNVSGIKTYLMVPKGDMRYISTEKCNVKRMRLDKRSGSHSKPDIDGTARLATDIQSHNGVSLPRVRQQGNRGPVTQRLHHLICLLVRKHSHTPSYKDFNMQMMYSVALLALPQIQ